MRKVALTIQGMHCQACVARVARAIEKVPGSRAESVTVGAATVDTEDAEAVRAAIEKAGYPATLLEAQG